MITMRDNDFSISLELLGETLLNIFALHEYPNSQEDLERIKEYVQYMTWGIHNISHAFLGKYSWTIRYQYLIVIYQLLMNMIFQNGIMQKAFTFRCLKEKKPGFY